VGACCSYLLLICFAHRPALTAIGGRYDTGLVRVWVVATANLAALVAEDREETARAALTRARETGRALYDRPVRAATSHCYSSVWRACVCVAHLGCVLGCRGAGAAAGAAWLRLLPRRGRCCRKHRHRGPRS